MFDLPIWENVFAVISNISNFILGHKTWCFSCLREGMHHCGGFWQRGFFR